MKINISIRYDIAVDIIRLDMELGKGRKYLFCENKYFVLGAVVVVTYVTGIPSDYITGLGRYYAGYGNKYFEI